MTPTELLILGLAACAVIGALGWMVRDVVEGR